MKKIVSVTLVMIALLSAKGQTPCSSDPVYRQLDFWIGQWDVYGKNGKLAGESKVDLILDSCIILENWRSASQFKGVYYSGKSFNNYNFQTKQWQQTWVDNVGGSTAYLQGHYDDNTMVFKTSPFQFNKDTVAVRRLSFFNLGPEKVRQLGEISKDNEQSWKIEYDLEYRRRKQ
jgi:hypothetical protein